MDFFKIECCKGYHKITKKFNDGRVDSVIITEIEFNKLKYLPKPDYRAEYIYNIKRRKNYDT